MYLEGHLFTMNMWVYDLYVAMFLCSLLAVNPSRGILSKMLFMCQLHCILQMWFLYSQQNVLPGIAQSFRCTVLRVFDILKKRGVTTPQSHVLVFGNNQFLVWAFRYDSVIHISVRVKHGHSLNGIWLGKVMPKLCTVSSPLKRKTKYSFE